MTIEIGPRRRPPSQVHCGSIHAEATVREPGTLVSKPVGALQCWGCTHSMPGTSKRLERPTQCLSKRRAGRLTCVSHWRVEDIAQEVSAAGDPPLPGPPLADSAGSATSKCQPVRSKFSLDEQIILEQVRHEPRTLGELVPLIDDGERNDIERLAKQIVAGLVKGLYLVRSTNGRYEITARGYKAIKSFSDSE